MGWMSGEKQPPDAMTNVNMMAKLMGNATLVPRVKS
jgi:hypothetical protein